MSAGNVDSSITGIGGTCIFSVLSQLDSGGSERGSTEGAGGALVGGGGRGVGPGTGGGGNTLLVGVGVGTACCSIVGVAGVYARKKRRLRNVRRPEPSTFTLY